MAARKKARKPAAAKLAHISKDLRPLAVETSALTLDPSNVMQHPEEQVERIKRSLARFGQRRPLVVDQQGVVIAGNGTLLAAQALGWQHVAVVREDDSKAEAIAFGIADNRSAEGRRWDKVALAKQLQALKPDLAAAAGYAKGEIERLQARLRERPTSQAGSELDKVDHGQRDELAELAGFKTAQRRGLPSAPMVWYRKQGLLTGDVLDFGGGLDPHRLGPVFDPFHAPDWSLLARRYDVVTCNYVLNVVPLEALRAEVILSMRALLKPGGHGLVAVWKKGSDDSKSAKGYQCGWSRAEWHSFLKRLVDVERLDAPAFWAWKITDSTNN